MIKQKKGNITVTNDKTMVSFIRTRLPEKSTLYHVQVHFQMETVNFKQNSKSEMGGQRL
jgi:hypothetical protein